MAKAKLGQRVEVKGHWTGNFTGVLKYKGCDVDIVLDDRDGKEIEIIHHDVITIKLEGSKD